MKQNKNTKSKKNNSLITCVFCKKPISNNTINPLVCICEIKGFYHFECYKKFEGVEIRETVKDFLKASVKY